MKNTLLLVAVSLAWAAEYIFIGRAVSVLAPLQVSAVLMAAGALVLLVAVGGVLRRPLLETLRSHPALMLFMAVAAMILPTLLTVVAEESIAPELAALVGTTVPIATLFLRAALVRGARIDLREVVGALLAVAGLAVFLGVSDLSRERAEILGALTMASGGVVFALSGVLVAPKVRRIDPLVLTTWTVTLGAAGLILAAAVRHEIPAGAVDAEALAQAALGGVLCVGFAYAVYYELIRRAGAYFASLYAYLVPPLGFVLGVVLDGEQVTTNRVAGLAIVLAGLALTAAGSPTGRTGAADDGADGPMREDAA